jgi:hypothetical protein
MFASELRGGSWMSGNRYGFGSIAAVTEQAGPAALELVHPLYLDVPMMVSFLAALEGSGVAFEGEELATAGTTGSKTKEGGGRIGLPAIGALFGIDLSGRIESG